MDLSILRSLPCAGAALLLGSMPIAQGNAPSEAKSWEQKLGEVRAEPWEMRWRLIPMETSISKALTVAREAKKPVFLYAGDGDVDTGNA